jgi:hypothetical protein
MAIGAFRSIVIDVNDLRVGETFWSEVTGLDMVASATYGGRFSFLGTGPPEGLEVVLQLRATQKGDLANRAHIDVTPTSGTDQAVSKIIAIGGSVKKEPSIYPRPGSIEGKRPTIDWTVMQDPFGNEFCLIVDLSREQSDAVLAAAEYGATTDHEYRVAAGMTPPG